jgi:hypothetical protein
MNTERDPLPGALRAVTEPTEPMRCRCGTRGHPICIWCQIGPIEMVVCAVCGDKRCVHARDEAAPCAKADIYAHNAWIERKYVLDPLRAPVSACGFIIGTDAYTDPEGFARMFGRAALEAAAASEAPAIRGWMLAQVADPAHSHEGGAGQIDPDAAAVVARLRTSMFGCEEAGLSDGVKLMRDAIHVIETLAAQAAPSELTARISPLPAHVVRETNPASRSWVEGNWAAPSEPVTPAGPMKALRGPARECFYGGNKGAEHNALVVLVSAADFARGNAALATPHPAPDAPEHKRIVKLLDDERHKIVAALYGPDVAAQRGYQAGDLDRLIAKASPAPDAPTAARWKNALHCISLCSQNSMSSKEECGRIAREALRPTQAPPPATAPGA